MRPFKLQRAENIKQAVDKVSQPDTVATFIGGGTSLVDLMKIDVMRPETLVDINRIPGIDVTEKDGAIFIGATAKNSEVAHHPLIKKFHPILSQALLAGASVQLRNMATIGGNIMQRSRCPYFRDTTMSCNKREPGTGCPAKEGYSRLHAILGVSDQCISAHPSDMCVALAALDAIVYTLGPKGERKIPLREFHLMPEEHPELETVLLPGEMIVQVEIPKSKSKFDTNVHYLKIRDRSSFTFAIVAVAACLELDGTRIRDARLALGGVGTKPWRVESSESILVGKAATKVTFEAAANEALKGAVTSKYNKFKIELTKRSIVRALEIAAGVS